MYNYSVIIPHRNSPELLKRALASIPQRVDIQIIVEDNSPMPLKTDDVASDRLFELYYSDSTKGAGRARNEGMSRAEGKWLLFLDADDYYLPKAFDAFDKYIDSEYDIVFFKGNSENTDTGCKADRDSYFNTLIDNYLSNPTEYEPLLRYRHEIPSFKMIRRRMIMQNNVRFDEVPAGNDVMFSVKAGHKAKAIAADPSLVYCLTVTDGSITKHLSKKNVVSRFKVKVKQNRFLCKVGHKDLRQELFYHGIMDIYHQFGIFTAISCILWGLFRGVNVFYGYGHSKSK